MTFTGGEIKSQCVCVFFFPVKGSHLSRPTTRLHYCSSAALSDTIEEGTSREGWLRRNMSPCDGGGTMMTDSAAQQWTLEGGRERQGWRTGVEQSDTDTSCLPLARFTLRSVFWFVRLVPSPCTSPSTCFAKSFLENILLNSF